MARPGYISETGSFRRACLFAIQDRKGEVRMSDANTGRESRDEGMRRAEDAGDVSGRVSGSLDNSGEALRETADAGVDSTLVGATSTRTGPGDSMADRQEGGVDALSQEG
jgi:hypothetical protein